MDNNDINRPIKIRKYYALEITLNSPICISNGQSDATDEDILVNRKGEAFIPGTSLAGAIRDYLNLNKNQESIFGYSFTEGDIDFDGNTKEKTAMSSVFVSDVYFDLYRQKKSKQKKPIISVRDRVALDNSKQVMEKEKNKFDMQIVETGASGVLYLNYLVRENEVQDNFEIVMYNAFSAIQEGFIRVGANKNRGYGRLEIEKIHKREFKCEQGERMNDQKLEAWMKFKKNSKKISNYSVHQTFEEWKKEYNKNVSLPIEEEKVKKDEYIRLQVPLKLTGGISIRKYSAIPGEADYQHITCNEKPVIPGTSWTGAIRADVRDILIELGADCNKRENLLNKWFGFVSQNDKTAEQSRVIIAESVINGSEPLRISRNKINRFDASTIKGALYTEIAYFGGKTELEIMVRRDVEGQEPHYWLALLAILDMVIQDIKEGYVAVGGLTSIGRGIFAEDLERSSEKQYPSEDLLKIGSKELYDLLNDREN